jgi:hypothetical protein
MWSICNWCFILKFHWSEAGNGATSFSNFFGGYYQATNATQSNFFGTSAGSNATNASYSNFMVNAGKEQQVLNFKFLWSCVGNNANNASQSNSLVIMLVMVQQMHLTQVSLSSLARCNNALVKFHYFSAGYGAKLLHTQISLV